MELRVKSAYVTQCDGCRQLFRFHSTLTSVACVGWVSENDMLLSRVYLDKYKELESLLVEKDLALNETYMVQTRLQPNLLDTISNAQGFTHRTPPNGSKRCSLSRGVYRTYAGDGWRIGRRPGEWRSGR